MLSAPLPVTLRAMKSGPVLALAGFCLILLQFFMIREVTALLRGTELFADGILLSTAIPAHVGLAPVAAGVVVQATCGLRADSSDLAGTSG